jgi:hypothetical protein
VSRHRRLKREEARQPSLFAEGYHFGIGFWIAGLVVNLVAGAIAIAIAILAGVKL